MSTQYLNNKVPRMVQNGINDQSVPPQVLQPEVLPIHLPLVYIFAPKGPLDNAYLVTNGTDVQSIYGAGALDYRQGFFTHQTLLLHAMLDQGNAVFVKRIASPSIVAITALGASTSTKSYTIVYLGTTSVAQWQAVGVVGTPVVGNTFTSNGTAGVGTGIVSDVATLPTKANMVLIANIDSTTKVYSYVRDSFGNVLYDINGNPVYNLASSTTVVTALTSGLKYQIAALGTTTNSQWTTVGVTGTAAVGTVFTCNGGTGVGTGTVYAYTPITGAVTIKYQWIPTGVLTAQQLNSSITYNTATWYPLIQVVADSEGSLGNTTGLKIWTAGPNAVNTGDQDVIADQQALLFNAQVMTISSSSTGSIINNVLGETYFTFALKPNAYNYKYNVDLPISNLVTQWSDDGFATGTVPIFGPISAVNVFEANLEFVLNTLLTAENLSNPTPLTSKWMIDLFTGIQNSGIPHYGFQVDPTGAILSSGRTYYMQGGQDGDLSNGAYEREVVNQVVNNYQTPTCNLLDWGLYPFSAIYDTGFSNTIYPGYTLTAKKALFNWMGLRQNVHVTVGTHVVGGSTLQISDEISALADLISSAQINAESTMWGTPACRATILCQSGKLANYSWYNKRVSTVFDLAIRRATYFGAGSGKAKAGKAYNIFPANIVTSLTHISNTSLTLVADTAVWSGGGNVCQTYDRRSNFWPTTQSIYSTPSSVVNNEIFMQICCDIKSVSDMVWKQLSGTDNLTNSEFAKESNILFSQMVKGKYDDKVICVPNTYFTASDVARGNTWTMDVTVYGNVAKTVGQVNIITKRQVDTATTGSTTTP